MSNLANAPKWNFYVPRARPAPAAYLKPEFERRALGLKNFGTDLRFDSSTYADFWKLFAVYLKTTDEKKVVYQKLCDMVLEAKWRKDGRLLDIGTGEGSLTTMLVKHFSEGVLLEKYDNNMEKLRKLSALQKKNFTIVQGDFPQVAIEGKADFVYLGHVIYFWQIEKTGKREEDEQMLLAKWAETIQQAYGHVKEGGKLAVTAHGSIGQVRDMIEGFGGRSDDIDGLASRLISLFGHDKVELHAVQTRHYAETYEGMRAIVGFFMMDTGAKFSEKEMHGYINEFHRNDGYYCITKYDQTIVVNK